MVEAKKFIKKSLKSLLRGNSPGLIIIGAQKSGTSSLHRYLNAHPQLIKSDIKEIHFFDKDENYSKGFNWYHNHFKFPRKEKKIFYESTPSYIYRKYVAERIYKYNPHIKLIAILRNPVERAYSSWNMYRSFFENNQVPENIQKSMEGTNANSLYKYLYHGRNKFPSFKECISIERSIVQSGLITEEPSFIRRGIYYLQLIEYLKYFPKEQFLILGFKDLVKNKLEMLKKIEQFLGIENYDYSIAEKIISKGDVSQTVYPEETYETTKADLEEFYAPWNKKLFELTGKKLNW